MIVAAALFDRNISPRLDFCDGFLVQDTERGQSEALRVRAAQLSRADRLNLLTRLNVEILLTGGIRRCDYFFLTHSGIRVLTGLTGEAEARIAEYLHGTLSVQAPCFDQRSQPGCRRRLRRRKGG